ncbi:MAG: hypothetical protein JNM18_08115 [Planctomycetaceae bacterium]|nr:hypothetical protein [Planctomycetaceae bacterium]
MSHSLTSHTPVSRRFTRHVRHGIAALTLLTCGVVTPHQAWAQPANERAALDARSTTPRSGKGAHGVATNEVEKFRAKLESQRVRQEELRTALADMGNALAANNEQLAKAVERFKTDNDRTALRNETILVTQDAVNAFAKIVSLREKFQQSQLEFEGSAQWQASAFRMEAEQLEMAIAKGRTELTKQMLEAEQVRKKFLDAPSPELKQKLREMFEKQQIDSGAIDHQLRKSANATAGARRMETVRQGLAARHDLVNDAFSKLNVTRSRYANTVELLRSIAATESILREYGDASHGLDGLGDIELQLGTLTDELDKIVEQTALNIDDRQPTTTTAKSDFEAWLRSGQLQAAPPTTPEVAREIKPNRVAGGGQ